MSNRLLCWPLLCLVGLLVLAGCQAQLPSWSVPWRTPPDIAQTTGPTPTGDDGRTPVRFLALPGSEAENAQLQAVVERFQEEQPTLAISLTLPSDYDAALTAALANQPPPDLFVLDLPRAVMLTTAGALAPLDGVVDSPDDFQPLLRNRLTQNGQLYCAPREMRTLALVFNRDRFDKAGLAYPTAAWGWQDLRTAAEALTDKTAATVGLALPPDFSRWLPFLYQAGGSVTDEAMTVMTINSAEAATAMDFYVQLVIDGFAAPPADLEASWAGEALGNGRAAMAIEGNWVVPYLHTNVPQAHFGVVELPSGPQGRATLLFATCYAIAANAAHPEAARQLVGYLTRPATMSMLADTDASQPARLSLLEPWRQSHPEQEAFVTGLAYARPWGFDARFNPFFVTINTGLQQAFLSVRSVTDILAEADGVGNSALGR